MMMFRADNGNSKVKPDGNRSLILSITYNGKVEYGEFRNFMVRQYKWCIMHTFSYFCSKT